MEKGAKCTDVRYVLIDNNLREATDPNIICLTRHDTATNNPGNDWAEKVTRDKVSSCTVSVPDLSGPVKSRATKVHRFCNASPFLT